MTPAFLSLLSAAGVMTLGRFVSPDPSDRGLAAMGAVVLWGVIIFRGLFLAN